jgi:hypothetical protein
MACENRVFASLLTSLGKIGFLAVTIITYLILFYAEELRCNYLCPEIQLVDVMLVFVCIEIHIYNVLTSI